MPLVNVIWSKNSANDETRSAVAAGIEKGLRRGAGVKAKVHVSFIDSTGEEPVVQVWWTTRPQDMIDGACKAIEEEIRPALPEDLIVYYNFCNIPRGNFGANGEIMNKAPNPEKGIY